MERRPLAAATLVASSVLTLALLTVLGPAPYGGPSGLWGALTFQAPFWAFAPAVGVSGITLWMAAAVIAVFPEDQFTLAWTLAIGGACFAFTIPVNQGLSIPLGVPLVMGSALGSRALAHERGTGYAARAAFGATFVGIFAGSDLLAILTGRLQPPPSGFSVIGGAGVVDALVVAPVLASLWVAAYGLLRTRMGGDAAEATRGPLLHRSKREAFGWTGIGIIVAVPAWAAHLLG